ncbi:hypothetical protein BG015_000156 [Linnemannia schmuckeri]|uniref:Uncharacterized protein n=1 Tax=Linnemannia schmuckeri TaxID=64567 RepID=A0A9P5S802_9FUNG|nr:hypothetical protein BG015_000156 [Linnemannia schmuckeri]
MTLDDTPALDTSLASMNRLQLQAACVKLGLDSTPENELLRKQLREHEGYMQSHAHSSSATIANTTIEETEQDSVSHQPTDDTDVAMEDAPEVQTEESIVATIKVELEQEEEQQQHQGQDTAEEAEAQPEAMAVEELLIKQEVMDEHVQETSPLQDPTLVEVKIEKEETEVVIKQEKDTASSSTITIKQEKEEETIVTIKQEKIDAKSPSDDIKKEDSPVPIAQRRQLWEARSAAPSQQRSGLPLSKARINNQHANVQKRRRTADGEDDDVSMGEHSSPTPPSGTVRKLIGKFAGSSISAPSSPVGKKRRVDLPTTKSSPGLGGGSGDSTFPSIPKFKRVVKIPVSSTRAGSSLYAMGNSASRSVSGAIGARRKAASDSANSTTDKTSLGPTPPASAPTAGTTPKKIGSSKPVSAETINRLATPKKINTPASAAALSNVAPVPAPNFGASTSTAPSTATVTKARGPVLSTAARAAQRQKK